MQPVLTDLVSSEGSERGGRCNFVLCWVDSCQQCVREGVRVLDVC